MDKNPIDKDKVSENPAGLTHPHNVGGAIIKPIDRGKVKGRAMSAMVEQTNSQMEQIHEQAKVLQDQANRLRRRVEVSERIYNCSIGFEPLIGHTYYFYEKKDGGELLSKVGPEEWGAMRPFRRYVAKVKLLADHTWEVMEEGEEMAEGS